MTTTANVRRRHPRPQFVRDADLALILDGEWTFAGDPFNVGLLQSYERKLPDAHWKIRVPFSHQTKASGLSDTQQYNVVWYSRSVPLRSLPRSDRSNHSERGRYLLHFGAVDYEASVWVNGQLVGSHVGGHTSFSLDFTEQVNELLSPAKPNLEGSLLIAVRAQDAPRDMSQPRGKQYWKQTANGDSLPESIFYTPTTGIWQTVWIECVPTTYMSRATIAPDVDAGTVQVDVDINFEYLDPLVSRKPFFVECVVKLAEHEECSTRAPVSQETSSCSMTLSVRQSGRHPAATARARMVTPGVLPPEVNRDAWDNGLALWSPEHPQLYDLTLKLTMAGEADKVCDRVDSYFGMRKVSIDSQGRFCLNNRVYFQKLLLDQGYWPESGMTAPTPDAFEVDIMQAKAMGFNGVRKHQKVEASRFLYDADRLGFLVWGEMANAYEFSSRYVERFTREWMEAVRRDVSHPSIVAWVPINESWGVPALNTSAHQRSHLAALYHLTKSLDPTRPVVDNDGWQHVYTDMITVHDYRDAETLERAFATRDAATAERVVGYPVVLPPLSGQQAATLMTQKLPILCTEFGGLGLRVDNVSKTEGGVAWGYANASSQDDFLRQFEQQVRALVKHGVVQGFCYTQLADVEQEVNGLLTADRKFKLDPNKVKAILDSVRPLP
ncbi:glycoside hydrolase [Testicularia cyperi]|uniref:Glycoside hydrolase n=1 Tax=Testicularia cyperi TaxID=1882483 RepID=A0A317XRC8_9BASI|nr:glycoside hydrolase [Testicularia cyperi]